MQTDGANSFLRAARAGNLDKVLEYLKGTIDIDTANVVSNLCDEAELSVNRPLCPEWAERVALGFERRSPPCRDRTAETGRKG